VSALADRVQAEFRVAARPGGFGGNSGEFADPAGDPYGSDATPDDQRHSLVADSKTTSQVTGGGSSFSDGGFDVFWVHGLKAATHGFTCVCNRISWPKYCRNLQRWQEEIA